MRDESIPYFLHHGTHNYSIEYLIGEHSLDYSSQKRTGFGVFGTIFWETNSHTDQHGPTRTDTDIWDAADAAEPRRLAQVPQLGSEKHFFWRV